MRVHRPAAAAATATAAAAAAACCCCCCCCLVVRAGAEALQNSFICGNIFDDVSSKGLIWTTRPRLFRPDFCLEDSEPKKNDDGRQHLSIDQSIDIFYPSFHLSTHPPTQKQHKAHPTTKRDEGKLAPFRSSFVVVRRVAGLKRHLLMRAGSSSSSSSSGASSSGGGWQESDRVLSFARTYPC